MFSDLVCPAYLYLALSDDPGNRGPQTKSSPPPVFIKQFYWNTTICLHIVDERFHISVAELNSDKRLRGLRSLKHLLARPLQKKLNNFLGSSDDSRVAI